MVNKLKNKTDQQQEQRQSVFGLKRKSIKRINAKENALKRINMWMAVSLIHVVNGKEKEQNSLFFN